MESPLIVIAPAPETAAFVHQRDAHDAFMDIVAPAVRLLGGGSCLFYGTAEELDDYRPGPPHWVVDGSAMSVEACLRIASISSRLTDNGRDRLPLSAAAGLRPRPRTRRNEPMPSSPSRGHAQ